MPRKTATSIFAAAALVGVSLTGAIAVEPAGDAVIYAPAPEATLIDPQTMEVIDRGDTQLLQIDSLTDGGSAVLQFGFANGEIGAVTFNIDPQLFPIKIINVQVYWSSALANMTESLQDSLLLYTGNFNLLANLEGPVLTDGVLNEFDLSALNIVINNPTPLTAGLQFFDAPNGDALKPTLATDNNGCTSGQNWVFIPGANNWFNLCSFGVSGDLVIRVTIDPMGAVAPCPGDINGDGLVDTADLGLLIAVFGEAPPSVAAADINEDGVADTADLGLLISNFNTVCP